MEKNYVTKEILLQVIKSITNENINTIERDNKVYLILNPKLYSYNPFIEINYDIEKEAILKIVFKLTHPLSNKISEDEELIKKLYNQNNIELGKLLGQEPPIFNLEKRTLSLDGGSLIMDDKLSPMDLIQWYLQVFFNVNDENENLEEIVKLIRFFKTTKATMLNISPGILSTDFSLVYFPFCKCSSQNSKNLDLIGIKSPKFKLDKKTTDKIAKLTLNEIENRGLNLSVFPKEDKKSALKYLLSNPLSGKMMVIIELNKCPNCSLKNYYNQFRIGINRKDITFYWPYIPSVIKKLINKEKFYYLELNLEVLLN